MAEEKLALSDFFKTQTVVFASGVENTKEQEQNLNGLPICKNGLKVTTKSVKLAKAHKVSAK